MSFATSCEFCAINCIGLKLNDEPVQPMHRSHRRVAAGNTSRIEEFAFLCLWEFHERSVPGPVYKLTHSQYLSSVGMARRIRICSRIAGASLDDLYVFNAAWLSVRR
jgi:hypothetical protein